MTQHDCRSSLAGPAPAARLRMVGTMIILAAGTAARAVEPIRLHPDNPHYFLFRGKPAVLITSGEHYGAVLNLDFDYTLYLKTLESCGFNLTRTFSGAYCEPAGAFGIRNNTLAPAPGRLICPWARSSSPGYNNGGNRFDLQRWDPEYFRRLRSFVAEAGRRGIVVELVLFCPFYEKTKGDAIWRLSPMNAENNVNHIGNVPSAEVYTLKHANLLQAQVAMVRRIVEELRDADNVYYEICNEPYHGGVSPAWQDTIAETVARTESALGTRHLIAQNIANKRGKIAEANPLVSIFNFHYAQPEAVVESYHLNKALADDETGFRGREPTPYRLEAWNFILAGGAVFNHLDYSFTCGREDGTATSDAPGGGGPEIRRQLSVLKRFIEGFDFIRMRPALDVVTKLTPESTSLRLLAEPGRAYAGYLVGKGPVHLNLSLPGGTYQVEWLDPQTGRIQDTRTLRHEGHQDLSLRSPDFATDIAVRVVSTTGKANQGESSGAASPRTARQESARVGRPAAPR